VVINTLPESFSNLISSSYEDRFISPIPSSSFSSTPIAELISSILFLSTFELYEDNLSSITFFSSCNDFSLFFRPDISFSSEVAYEWFLSILDWLSFIFFSIDSTSNFLLFSKSEWAFLISAKLFLSEVMVSSSEAMDPLAISSSTFLDEN